MARVDPPVSKYISVAILAPIMRETAAEDIDACLAAMTGINVHQMRERALPTLYQSGVRYLREGNQPRESWRTALEVLAHKGGDCEDLACYRAAELILGGEDARARVIPSSSGWHIIVRRECGRVEDPSARLGMLDR